MTRLAASILVVMAVTAEAQAQTFEVASIKRNTSAGTNSSVRVQPGGRVNITNSTLFLMLRNLHRMEGFQIIGGPDWIHTDRWDIIAKAPGDADQPTIIGMARALLADRFKLVVHDDRRDLPIYALVRRTSGGALGPQLQSSTLVCPRTLPELRAFDAAGPRRAPNGAPACGSDVSPGRFLAGARTMADVARMLTPLAGRTVIDQTGLQGAFDLDLKWNDSEDGPSLFTALQEQLGLKLDSQRGPVDVLVIDSVQRPTED